jgi:hypothetical protein
MDALPAGVAVVVGGEDAGRESVTQGDGVAVGGALAMPIMPLEGLSEGVAAGEGVRPLGGEPVAVTVAVPPTVGVPAALPLAPAPPLGVTLPLPVAAPDPKREPLAVPLCVALPVAPAVEEPPAEGVLTAVAHAAAVSERVAPPVAERLIVPLPHAVGEAVPLGDWAPVALTLCEAAAEAVPDAHAVGEGRVRVTEPLNVTVGNALPVAAMDADAKAVREIVRLALALLVPEGEGVTEAASVAVARAVAKLQGEPLAVALGAPRVAVATSEKVPPPHSAVGVGGAVRLRAAVGDALPLREPLPVAEGEAVTV